MFSFSAMLSINLTTSFQYSSKLLFFLNIVTYFVLSKQIWILYDQLFQSFHMKVNRCRHLFSIGGQLLTFIKKFYEGQKSNFGCRIFVFVLPIRNKSPFSGKIITSFKIERMSLDLLAIWPKHKIEMQIIYDDK